MCCEAVNSMLLELSLTSCGNCHLCVLGVVTSGAVEAVTMLLWEL